MFKILGLNPQATDSLLYILGGKQDILYILAQPCFPFENTKIK